MWCHRTGKSCNWISQAYDKLIPEHISTYHWCSYHHNQDTECSQHSKFIQAFPISPHSIPRLSLICHYRLNILEFHINVIIWYAFFYGSMMSWNSSNLYIISCLLFFIARHSIIWIYHYLCITCWWTFALFPGWGCHLKKEAAAINICIWVFVWK